ncbi:MAG: hypothetical protein OXJ56_10100 [Rhodospirillaceae bacterium]|nr:hypothetical protein [Rhodospirillaceae bacterium]
MIPLLAKLLSLAAAGMVALSTPALAQDQEATVYRFKVTNFTELDVNVTCGDGSGTQETVASDDISPVITCGTDEITVVQSGTDITMTFGGRGNDCQPEDILHPVLGGTTTWLGGVLQTEFPYASMHAHVSCDEAD